MDANSHERTEELRKDIRLALSGLGVQSFAIAFSDPDTHNWTWSVGNNDPEALGMMRLMCMEFESRLQKG